VFVFESRCWQVEYIEAVNLHFIAFVHVNGSLYELDGTKSAPINHGPTTQDALLTNSVAVIRQFMDRDPEELRFNMVIIFLLFFKLSIEEFFYLFEPNIQVALAPSSSE
jgi:hypothetical protein